MARAWVRSSGDGETRAQEATSCQASGMLLRLRRAPRPRDMAGHVWQAQEALARPSPPCHLEGVSTHIMNI